MFFRCVFHLENIGFAETNVKKKSVVSVWYAQNSLPFCTEVWYTTLTSCEEPTKNANAGLYPFADAARTPHGDSNEKLVHCFRVIFRYSPHPSRGQQHIVHRRVVLIDQMQPAPLTGTVTWQYHAADS